MIVRTLNSTYEVEFEPPRFRRLGGVHAPTPRQGVDGEWVTLHSIIDTSDMLIFVYEVTDEGVMRTTMTSQIVGRGEV